MSKLNKTIAAALAAGMLTTAAAADREAVLSFGGVFFKAENPAALAKWYEEHLGVKQKPKTYEEQPWVQAGGSTVFGVFNSKTKYFGADVQQFMFNFRVRDLDAMVAQLHEAGIEVKVDPETYPNGRFARLADPEGNPIQLWQEMTPEPATNQ
ncbi:VOC family protein [Pseudidiomarina sp. GXY010]|uniref:VOC family protein n=1 Tax=Pseudidiomarina fusca TaxID=2965078 RepID=A0ABU3KZV9_9GAMM|nr:VOC family protein [Pseudidiomarina sp. GXY010]MDT7526426.1 VOC family protein [Pseudidiomarina sp. GXY010]